MKKFILISVVICFILAVICAIQLKDWFAAILNIIWAIVSTLYIGGMFISMDKLEAKNKEIAELNKQLGEKNQIILDKDDKIKYKDMELSEMRDEVKRLTTLVENR